MEDDLGLLCFEDGSFAEALFKHLDPPENVAMLSRGKVTMVHLGRGESLVLDPEKASIATERVSLATERASVA